MKVIHFVSLFILVVFSACTNNQKKEDSIPTQNKVIEAPQLPAKEKIHNALQTLDSIKTDVLEVGGHPSEINLLLYAKTTDFPFMFYTYYPEDMNVSAVNNDNADAVVFKHESASLSLNVLPETFQTKKEVEDYIIDVLHVASPDVKKKHGYFTAENLEKRQWVSIQEHNHRFYYWLEDASWENTDDLASRAKMIRDHFAIIQ